MLDEARVALRKAEQTPRRKQALRVWLRLLSASQLIEKGLRNRFRKEFATTLPRFDVMAALAREPEGQTMGAVSQWLLVSRGNLTGIVSRLVDDGLVIRTRSSGDRRAHLVRLTPRGQAEFDRMSQAHERWIKRILADMTRDELATLDELLRKVKAGLIESE